MDKLNEEELLLLSEKNIEFDSSLEYSDDELLDIADKVRNIEIMYSQMNDDKSVSLANKYGKIADKIEAM